MQLLKDVMTHSVEVIAPDATLAAAADLMRTLEVGALPVREGERLVGMVTDRDITIRATAKSLDPQTARVRDVMTPNVVSCFDDQTVKEAAELMARKHVRRLVVLNRNQRLVGIVSLDDLAVDLHDKRLIGETLEHIVERPKAPEQLYGRIIVALDGSKLAEQVLPHVQTLARKFGSTVTLVYAVMPLQAAFLSETPAGISADIGPATKLTPVTEDMRRDAIEYLTAIKDRLHEQGLNVDVEHPEGRAAEVIVQRARHLRADLIAMTTHGRSGLGRAVFGSVADEVLRTAPCPVLLIRGSEHRS